MLTGARDLVRHVGVHRIVPDPINTGLRDDFARFVFLRHFRLLKRKLMLLPKRDEGGPRSVADVIGYSAAALALPAV